MITRLKQWQIEAQAIEQLLDMEIPENKMLLAMYIVTSEVENDRKSINVKQGMYRARQEGNWLGKAPLGYIYKNQRLILEYWYSMNQKLY